MLNAENRLDYAVHVPEGAHGVRPWIAQLREPAPAGERRTLGHAPEVTLDNFDVRPGVCRTRITLTALDETTARLRALSFPVDRGFAEMLKPHDVLHIAQDWHGGLGLSVLRHGVLIAAAGAVSAAPLGETIVVRKPGDLARQVDAIYRARDPKYTGWEYPVQIETDLGIRLVHRGYVDLGRHEFFVVHGFVLGSECVAISFVGVCPDCAARLTAPLLSRSDAIRIKHFRDPKEE